MAGRRYDWRPEEGIKPFVSGGLDEEVNGVSGLHRHSRKIGRTAPAG